MATLTHHESATAEHLELSAKTRRTFITIIVAGVILLVVGLILAATGFGAEHHTGEHGTGMGASAHHEEGSAIWVKRLLVSIWHSNVFFTGIAVIGTFFVALQYVAYAGWSVLVKRIAESFSAWLPVSLVIMLVVFFIGKHDLFHWTHDGIMDPKSEHYDAIIAGKSGFLNQPFYLVRMVVYLGIWWFFSERLRKLSLEEDLNGGTAYFHKSINVAALFLVLFAVTSSMSAWDWVMSIDTHWYSTMFGWYVFASWWVSGIAAVSI
jgi:hypothetical protein